MRHDVRAPQASIGQRHAPGARWRTRGTPGRDGQDRPTDGNQEGRDENEYDEQYRKQPESHGLPRRVLLDQGTVQACMLRVEGMTVGLQRGAA
jgi:hypothetical protein